VSSEVEETINTKEVVHESQSASSSNGSLREAFLDWLRSKNPKNCSPDLADDCFDKSSEYSIRKKLYPTPLWNVTDYSVFKSIYNILINDKFFRIQDRSNYKLFLLVGRLYSTFLKQKPLSHKINLVASNESEEKASQQENLQKTPSLTIKEACISVLQNAKGGMTIRQIYEKIIAENLYSFGARNPESVIQTEIERACENSNSTVRMSNKRIFRSEINQSGKKIYFPLLVTLLDDTSQYYPDTNVRLFALQEEQFRSSKIEIWNKSIEQNFCIWMEMENYEPSSVRVYCNAVNQIYRDFRILVDIAVRKSSTMTEAASEFIALLQKDGEFLAISKVLNQFLPALSAFAKFIGIDSVVSFSEVDESSKTAIDDKLISEEKKSRSSKMEIWNKSIEKDFRIWMESGINTSSATKASVYSSTVDEIVQHFRKLVDKAIQESSTMSEAAHRLIAQLQQDSDFNAIKSKYLHLAALKEFARFIDDNSSNDMPAVDGTSGAAIDDMPLPKVEKAETPKVEVWNKSIERDFLAWMESKNYVPYTKKIYSRTIDQIVNNFTILLDTAVYKSTTMTEAASIFIELLRQDHNFTAKSSKNSQFSTSLAAFERFIGSESSDFSSDAISTNRTKTDKRYESGKTDLGSSKIEIWNKSIEQDFLTWMRKKNYASSNRKFYRFYVEMIMDDFSTLADQATRESRTMPEAARKFIVLLRQSREFEVKIEIDHRFNNVLDEYAEFVDYIDHTGLPETLVPEETHINKQLESEVNEELQSKLTDILFKKFPNGFRLDSPIELMRFRRFTADIFGEDIVLSDEELKSAISASGTPFKGKIYVVTAETESRIKHLVDEAFASGTGMIFYKAFYENNEDWLFPASIVSVEMLEVIFQKLFTSSSGYIHKKNYISNRSYTRNELTMIKNEIIRVWGKDVLVSYTHLVERLPYIPFEKIKSVLSYNSDFIWNSGGVYTHISKVNITEEERTRIASFVANSCLANGYASMSDIPMDEIEERNRELTPTAIQNAAFQICLSDKYDKKGKITTRKGGTLNALTIMKDYCRKLDKCSLDDLLSFQEELLGQRENQLISMEAAYAVLVRVDKNTFLAEKYVDFNTTEIDNVIALFVKGEYLPLKSFTTFVAFPHCGQPWNLFLLESYCRRFSERFRFDTPSVNSRNAGAVIRRSCVLTYVEIMADAVARSDVSYEKKAIGRFLYEKGYTGKTITAKASEIIEKAKTIRERKD